MAHSARPELSTRFSWEDIKNVSFPSFHEGMLTRSCHPIMIITSGLRPCVRFCRSSWGRCQRPRKHNCIDEVSKKNTPAKDAFCFSQEKDMFKRDDDDDIMITKAPGVHKLAWPRAASTLPRSLGGRLAYKELLVKINQIPSDQEVEHFFALIGTQLWSCLSICSHGNNFFVVPERSGIENSRVCIGQR